MAIFLTGSTGYIGAHIASNLLADHADSLNLLVRARDEQEARERLWRSLQLHMDFPQFQSYWHERFRVFRGDLTSAKFGLADDDYAQLIADSLGLKLDLQPIAWADWPLGLVSGKYDAVISNVGVTEQRKEKLRAASAKFLAMAYDGLPASGAATMTIGLRTPDYGDQLPAMLASLDKENGAYRHYAGWARHAYNDVLGAAAN